MRNTIIAIAALTLPAAALQAQANEPQTVVAQLNTAYQAGDFDAFIATFADDAVVVANGVELRGREAIAEKYVANFAEDAPAPRIERQGRVSGGGVVQMESYRFADGKEVCCTTSAIFVEGGQITRVVIDSSRMGG